MTDQGYPDNSSGMRLTLGKQLLRVLANTILDVRLQTMGMTDQQALDLMIKDTYQEKEEATAKLQRAKLSSCQLPTYFAGWKGWLQVRDRYQQKQGSKFSLKEFHERALKESAVPLPTPSAPSTIASPPGAWCRTFGMASPLAPCCCLRRSASPSPSASWASSTWRTARW
jgi:hypothetical protein